MSYTYARRANVHAVYEGNDISEVVSRYLRDVTYTDVASGESDSASVTVRDDERLWIDAWFPQKGERLRLEAIYRNWNEAGDEITAVMGSFQVDDVSFQGRPTTATIGGTAVPQNNALCNENKTRTWENTTVRQIGTQIAREAGIDLLYVADDINVSAIEQTDQTDCKFLYSLSQSYGLSMKAYENKIVIFDEEKIEQKPAAGVLWEEDLISWSYNTTMAGTYTGAVFSFTDPDTEQNHTIQIGGGERILNINVTADNLRDAELKGIAKLNDANKKATTLKIVTRANPYMVSGLVMQIEGLGKVSGKYYVERVTTKISGSGSSQQTVLMRKVVDRIKDVSILGEDEEKEEESTGGTDYTVKAGDTLWWIAKQFLGKGTRYVEIYEANKEAIEATAKRHGKKNSSNGHWIWPGEVLKIPGK